MVSLRGRQPCLWRQGGEAIVHGERPALLPPRYSTVRVGFQVAPADRGLPLRQEGAVRPQAQQTDASRLDRGCQLRGSLTRTRAPRRRWAILSRGSGRRIALRRTALDNPLMTSCLQMRWFSSDNGASRYLFDPSLPGQAPGAAAHARRRRAHTLSLGQRGEASRATRTAAPKDGRARCLRRGADVDGDQ
jgi:hypothetical protein